jgi:hypothetical protein
VACCGNCREGCAEATSADNLPACCGAFLFDFSICFELHLKSLSTIHELVQPAGSNERFDRFRAIDLRRTKPEAIKAPARHVFLTKLHFKRQGHNNPAFDNQ